MVTTGLNKEISQIKEKGKTSTQGLLGVGVGRNLCLGKEETS